MHPADVPKTAILTPFGLFEFKYMTFGLRNAAQTFQRFIDETVKGLPFVFPYLDDVLIASTSEAEHVEHLEQLFRRYRERGLVINEEKCQLGQSEVEFLGHLVSSKGIRPLPHKVTGILECKKPKVVHELRRFLGTINFYRRFLPHAAATEAPLQRLMGPCKKRDKTTISWTPEATEAFQKLKEQLANAALIAFPLRGATIALMTDASDIAVGAVLQQRVDNEWAPLGFYSQKCTSTEQRYSAYDRELLAIYKAIRHFRYFLEGTNFIIFTDHKPLMHAFDQKWEKLSPRQTRQLNYISQFSSDIRHISGADNHVADMLSRIETFALPSPIDMQHLHDEQSNSDELKELLNGGPTSLHLVQYHHPDTGINIVCDDSIGTLRPYVPESLRQVVFNANHGLAHPGAKATIKLISRNFVWKRMSSDLRARVRSCPACQRCKVARHTKRGTRDIRGPRQTFRAHQRGHSRTLRAFEGIHLLFNLCR